MKGTALRIPRWPAAVLLLALTACGSTVQANGGSSAVGLGTASSDGITAPGDGAALGSNQGQGSLGAGSAPDGAASGPGTTSGAVGSLDTTGGAAGVDNGAAPGSAGTPGSVASTGDAQSPKVLKVGVQYSSNAGATLGAIGSSYEASGGDPKDVYNAVIDYINAHGGAAGRRVQAVFDDVDATASPAQASQKSCTTWTQDERVSVALPTSAVQDNNLMRNCMGKAGVPVMYANVFSQSLADQFTKNPLWLESISTSLESYARSYVAGLAQQGFFRDGKLGIVFHDSPAFTAAMKSALLPALKQAGVNDPETYAANISGASDLGNGSAQMSSAVLAFRSAGVSRVMFFEPWVGYFTFLKAAENQNYKPLYGLSSQAAPEIAIGLGLVSPAQLAGAKLVSWWPLADVRDISRYLGPNQKLCLDIYRQAGVDVPPGDRLKFGGLLNICENLLLVVEAYRGAPATLQGIDFTRGLERLGSKAPFATKPAGGFSPTQHWGATTYYVGGFDSKCGCFALNPGSFPMRR